MHELSQPKGSGPGVDHDGADQDFISDCGPSYCLDRYSNSEFCEFDEHIPLPFFEHNSS